MMFEGLFNLLLTAAAGSGVLAALTWFLAKIGYLDDSKKGLNFTVSLVIGAILGSLAKTTVLMNKEFPRLVSAVESIEKLKTAENRFPHGYDPYASSWLWLDNNIEDAHIRHLFANGLNEIGENLSKLHREGMLRVDRKDIFDVWKKGFELSAKHVRATNRVAVEDWRFFSRDGDGADVQTAAMQRNVTIERIMLYDPGDSKQVEEFTRLAEQHKKLGVSVLWSNYPWEASRPFNQEYLSKLKTMDIVLFDDKLALLTKVNNIDRKMEYAYLTANPSIVKVAIELYENLKINSTGSPSNTTSSTKQGN